MGSLFRSFDDLVGKVAADDPVLVTYRYEQRRAVMSGIIETATTTFLLLIAVRWFNAGPTAKALLASSNSLGFLLTPLVVYLVQRGGAPVSRAASRFLTVGAWSFAIAAIAPDARIFVVASAFAVGMAGAIVPLMTQLYQDNYPALVRGRIFARTSMIRILASGAFGAFAGWLMSGRISLYPLLLATFAGCLAYAAFCVSRCPSRPIPESAPASLFSGFQFVRTDPVFRMTLICWMIMGFGNLMMIPLRVEYLANPEHGLALSEGAVALLVSVIPSLVRLVCSPIWGALFDRVNFFGLRVLVNAGFATGIAAFFFSDSPLGLVLGSVMYGFSNAGGEIVWSLWVTKFAPAGHVASYMSVHVFLTGVRGMLAPLVAFHLLSVCSFTTLGLISGGMIVFSSLLLLPETRAGRGFSRSPVSMKSAADGLSDGAALKRAEGS